MRRRAWEALYRMQPAPSVISRLSDAPETITLRVGAAGGLTRGHFQPFARNSGNDGPLYDSGALTRSRQRPWTS